MPWIQRASDDFQRADEWPIGLPWVGYNGNLRILGQTTGVYTRSGLACAHHSTAVVGSKQFAQIDVLDTTAGALNYCGPAVRMASGSGNLYGYLVNRSNGDSKLMKYVGGTATQLGSTIPIAPATGNNAARIEADGSSLACYYRGVQVGSCTDSTFPVGAVGQAFDILLFTFPRLDNWSGGDWEGEAVATRPFPVRQVNRQPTHRLGEV